MVLYLGAAYDPTLSERLIEHGGARVASPDPYGEGWGEGTLNAV